MSLHLLTAAELLERYRTRALSPVEVVRSVIDRVEALEPTLGATYAFDPQGALAAATESEDRWRRCEALPLDGVPAMIKENIATRGVPVPVGTAASDFVPAAADAPPAARLREAGAVILGKTTMPDYGMLSSGLSSLHPLTRTPWKLDRNPGGSSSGAAAGCAAGYGPLHIGTDIGGSIRLPAGWCGLVGFKPSNGRVPIDPPYYGRCGGPMTRTVEDAALMMEVLTRPDRRDHMSLPFQAIDWRAFDRDIGNPRIGLLLDAGVGLSVGPEVRAAVEAAARMFESAGASVEPMRPFLTRELVDGLDRFWRARAWADIGPLPDERKARILPFIFDWAKGGADLDGQQVFHGFSQMYAMRAGTLAAMEPYDCVLSPVAPMAAFAADLPCPTNDPARPFEHIYFTVAYNMSEQPAVSINCGYTADGLPIGLQIIGQRFDDLGVLRMARAWEAMRPMQRPWPMN